MTDANRDENRSNQDTVGKISEIPEILGQILELLDGPPPASKEPFDVLMALGQSHKAIRELILSSKFAPLTNLPSNEEQWECIYGKNGEGIPTALVRPVSMQFRFPLSNEKEGGK